MGEAEIKCDVNDVSDVCSSERLNSQAPELGQLAEERPKKCTLNGSVSHRNVNVLNESKQRVREGSEVVTTGGSCSVRRQGSAQSTPTSLAASERVAEQETTRDSSVEGSERTEPELSVTEVSCGARRVSTLRMCGEQKLSEDVRSERWRRRVNGSEASGGDRRYRQCVHILSPD